MLLRSSARDLFLYLAALGAIERAWLMLRQPGIAWTDYVEHIRKDGFPKVAAWARGLPEPQRTA